MRGRENACNKRRALAGARPYRRLVQKYSASEQMPEQLRALGVDPDAI